MAASGSFDAGLFCVHSVLAVFEKIIAEKTI